MLIQDADLEYSPTDYIKLLNQFQKTKRLKVLYGSRFLSGRNRHQYRIFRFGNWLVNFSFLLFYGIRLTDSATGYKLYHKELKAILITAKGNSFDWEPEVTSKILRKGYKIKEIPIQYNSRKLKEGKKIKKIDGLIALKTIIYWRFSKI